MLKIKFDRILKFTINFDLEILKNNGKTLLNTYLIGDIDTVQLAEKASKKIYIDFKNVKKLLIFLFILNNKFYKEKNQNFEILSIKS